MGGKDVELEHISGKSNQVVRRMEHQGYRQTDGQAERENDQQHGAHGQRPISDSGSVSLSMLSQSLSTKARSMKIRCRANMAAPMGMAR